MVAISSIVGFVVSAIFKLGSSSIVLGSGDSKIKEVKKYSKKEQKSIIASLLKINVGKNIKILKQSK